MSQTNVYPEGDKILSIYEKRCKNVTSTWERCLRLSDVVNIRFISTLTPEDENLMAPIVLKAVSAMLELVPIAYMLRIDTVDGEVFQHSRSGHHQPQLSTPDAMPSDNLLGAPTPTTRFDS